MRTSQSMTYSFSGCIVGLLGEVTQIRTKSLIFDTNNIYLIFFQKSKNVKRKKLKNQVLSFLEEYVYKQTVPFQVRYGICITSKPFSIWNGGITKVKQHADTITNHLGHLLVGQNRYRFLKMTQHNDCVNVYLYEIFVLFTFWILYS